jgi:AcrR family transcriptional regulator
MEALAGRRKITRPNLLAGEDLPPAPVQSRSRDKRNRLKTAALELFGEYGYEQTSIDQIAMRASVAVGGFYQYFRSKRQLLLALMDELVEKLSLLNLRPQASANVREGLRSFLSRAFSTDLQFLGAYRAWREAAISDPELADKETAIRAWTTERVFTAFSLLQQMPGARSDVDVRALAKVMDTFFWTLLAEATRVTNAQLQQWIDSATHLIYHALFTDEPADSPPKKRSRVTRKGS